MGSREVCQGVANWRTVKGLHGVCQGFAWGVSRGLHGEHEEGTGACHGLKHAPGTLLV